MAHRPWLSGLCMFLALLLLYNPFIAIYCSHSQTSLHTPQRNRASVGSSELQHFTPVQQEQTQQSDVNVEAGREQVSAPAESFADRSFAREEELSQPDLVASVWSRPPPSL